MDEQGSLPVLGENRFAENDPTCIRVWRQEKMVTIYGAVSVELKSLPFAVHFRRTAISRSGTIQYLTGSDKTLLDVFDASLVDAEWELRGRLLVRETRATIRSRAWLSEAEVHQSLRRLADKGLLELLARGKKGDEETYLLTLPREAKDFTCPEWFTDRQRHELSRRMAAKVKQKRSSTDGQGTLDFAPSHLFHRKDHLFPTKDELLHGKDDLLCRKDALNNERAGADNKSPDSFPTCLSQQQQPVRKPTVAVVDKNIVDEIWKMGLRPRGLCEALAALPTSTPDNLRAIKGAISRPSVDNPAGLARTLLEDPSRIDPNSGKSRNGRRKTAVEMGQFESDLSGLRIESSGDYQGRRPEYASESSGQFESDHSALRVEIFGEGDLGSRDVAAAPRNGHEDPRAAEREG